MLGDAELEERVDDLLLLTPAEVRERAAYLAEIAADDKPAACWANGDVVRRTTGDGQHRVYAARSWEDDPGGPCRASLAIDCPPGWFIPGLPRGNYVGPEEDYFAFDLTEPMLNAAGHEVEFATPDLARAAVFAEAERRGLSLRPPRLQSAPVSEQREAPPLAAA